MMTQLAFQDIFPLNQFQITSFLNALIYTGIQLIDVKLL